MIQSLSGKSTASLSLKRTVHVPLGERRYDITIAAGSLSLSGEMIRGAIGDKAIRAAIISNRKVHSHYGSEVEKSLRQAGFRTITHLIGDGESAKSLRTAQKAWGFLIERKVARSDVIVALGGGVVGDLAGFVAATYLRGIGYIQIPTTLLAQIDSSVGGKTAVNHNLGKNLIGAFHQPLAVLIDTSTLATLPRREMRAGLYEAVKYGVIADRSLSDFIQNNLNSIVDLDQHSLSHLISGCCQIKARVVTRDERESGLRRVLNFGHTVGHALETVTAYRRLKHGEAVGYGMKCASEIARRTGIIAAPDADTINHRIDALGPLPRIDDLKTAEIIAAMAHDKKVVQNRLPLILPTAVGSVVIRDDTPAAVVSKAVRDLLAGRY